jgi:hypothetical protein
MLGRSRNEALRRLETTLIGFEGEGCGSGIGGGGGRMEWWYTGEGNLETAEQTR